MQLNTLVLAMTAAFTSAQLVFNVTTDSFVCPASGGNFCPGPSLSINIIIRCTGTVGQPGNCNDNLAGVAPGGLKTNALCYQSSTTAGDAACSLNGIIYPDIGSPFPIPAMSKAAGTGTGTAISTSSNSATSATSVVLTISPNTTTSTLSAVTSTEYITPAALTRPIAAMATLKNAPYPIQSVSNNATGVGGVVLGSGTGVGAVTKSMSTFLAGSGRVDPGMMILGAGVFAAAVLL